VYLPICSRTQEFGFDTYISKLKYTWCPYISLYISLPLYLKDMVWNKAYNQDQHFLGYCLSCIALNYHTAKIFTVFKETDEELLRMNLIAPKLVILCNSVASSWSPCTLQRRSTIKYKVTRHLFITRSVHTTHCEVFCGCNWCGLHKYLPNWGLEYRCYGVAIRCLALGISRGTRDILKLPCWHYSAYWHFQDVLWRNRCHFLPKTYTKYNVHLG